MPDANNVPADGTGENVPVTREEFQQLLQRFDGQSKFLARLEKQISGKNAPAQTVSEGASGNEPAGFVERLKQIEARQHQIDEANEKLERGKIASSIARSLAKLGVDPVVAEDIAEVQLSKRRADFGIDETESVTFAHNGEQLGLDSWSKMFLATEKGSKYLPQKNGPSRVNLPSGRAATLRRVTVSAADLASGNYDPSLKPSEIVVE